MQPIPDRRSRQRSTVVLSILVAGTVWVMWPAQVPAPAVPHLRTAGGKPVPAQSEPTPLPSRRTTTAASAASLPPDAAPSPCDDFDAALERMVALGVETATALEAGDADRARQLDDDARQLFEVLARCPDADEKALAAVAAAPVDALSIRVRILRGVCRVLIQAGLLHRHECIATTGSRARLDALVTAMLGVLPQNEALAAGMSDLLAGQPYLDVAHENAVLELVALSQELAFLRGAATELLRTLWENLEKTGARTSAELASLALLFKDDANPTRRLAALQHLLTCGDPRYRRLVLDEVGRNRDGVAARELALVAARSLETEAAVAVLDELRPVAGDLTAAFLTLGEGGGEVLARAYEQHLADNRDPGLRADLVSGVGFNRTPEGLAIAKLAFQADPSPEVRARAMFVLSGNAAEALGESTLQAALDDPQLSSDPTHLGAIVLALENLARAGLINAVDRLGQQLRQRSELRPGDRQTLEQILARTLPGGGAPPGDGR